MKTLAMALVLACFLPLSIPLDADSHYYSRYSRYDSDIYWNIDVDFFYDYLEPYGDWVYSDDFGWVWIPYETPIDWCPYSRGHWIYSPFGWTWVSDFSWGWAPFHYGRWVMAGHYGWCWVPGSVWAPAWVSWRWSGIHVGWAPLPPWYDYYGWDGYGPSIEINIWVFVDWDHFCDRQVWRHCVERDEVRDVYHDTEDKRHLWNRGDRHKVGPERKFVEQKTNMTVSEREELRIKGIRPPSEFREKAYELRQTRGDRAPSGWDSRLVREKPIKRSDEFTGPTKVYRKPDAKSDKKLPAKPEVIRRGPQLKRDYSPPRVKDRPKLERKPEPKPKAKIEKPTSKSKDKKTLKADKSKKSSTKVLKSPRVKSPPKQTKKVRVSR